MENKIILLSSKAGLSSNFLTINLLGIDLMADDSGHIFEQEDTAFINSTFVVVSTILNFDYTDIRAKEYQTISDIDKCVSNIETHHKNDIIFLHSKNLDELHDYYGDKFKYIYVWFDSLIYPKLYIDRMILNNNYSNINLVKKYNYIDNIKNMLTSSISAHDDCVNVISEKYFNHGNIHLFKSSNIFNSHAITDMCDKLNIKYSHQTISNNIEFYLEKNSVSKIPKFKPVLESETEFKSSFLSNEIMLHNIENCNDGISLSPYHIIVSIGFDNYIKTGDLNLSLEMVEEQAYYNIKEFNDYYGTNYN